jgi:hypothetical protein
MLAHILALAVGFASFSLYMAAFFFPEVHRKYDLTWSGVGMFYALVLWVCAGRITGGVLLGQTASVTLLGWLGWQTLTLRRALTPIDQQTPLPGSAITISEAVQLKLQELQTRWQQQTQNSPVGKWLTATGEWAQVLRDSVAKPKQPRRQPPPELRQLQKPASVRRSPSPQPEATHVPRATETALDSELEQTTEVVEELITQVEQEVQAEATADPRFHDQPNEPLPNRERSTAPEAFESFDELSEVESNLVDDRERQTLQTATRRDRAVAKTNAKRLQQRNRVSALWERVQAAIRSLMPRQRPMNTKPVAAIDQPIEARTEIPEAEMMVAVLEETNPADDGIGAEVTVVEVVEVLSQDGVLGAEIEALEVEIIDDPQTPLSDDQPEPDSVTLADAVIEAELNWEAATPPSSPADDQPLADAVPDSAIDHQPDPSIGTVEWTDDTPIDTAGDQITVNEPSDPDSNPA